jgi:outer membrane biosynthesis protein TonB
MSVLSRRLERFAVGFSIAAFAFFLIGFYAAANNKGQVVFLLAGLVSVCLFATFFLWLAHGFAWAMIPDKTAEALKPAEAMKPAEVMKPAEALKPAEAMKPAEAIKPAEAMKPAEAKPAEALKPADAMKPKEAMKPAEAKRPAEEKKPAEEKVIASEDPPDAQYTITGRRVY